MMIPITRKEKYINEIVGGGNTAPETPQTREELFFADILGEVVAPSPITRAEKYLAKIANKYSGELPEPVTRIERFLARTAGMDVTIPTPITREEMFWADALIVEKELSGIPPLTFIGNGTTLKNYRIYGNTVNGESVGDRTDNIIRDYIVIQTQAQYAVVLLIDAELIPNTTYSFICLLNDFGLRLYVNENLFNTVSYVKDGIVLKVIVKTLPELSDSQKIDGKWVMLKNSVTEPVIPKLSNIMMIKGSKIPEIYEPYGYRVPVTVTNGTDTETTNIYLTEQIRKVGDEVEYIDFGEQKQHFADGTSVDVTLPALPTLSGTNTLSVGTEVQPSNVYIKYEGVR